MMDNEHAHSADPRVLVVSADPAERRLLACLLDAQGFQTEGVASAGDAENILRAQEVDLIILDGPLRDGGAIAVCRRLAVTDTVPIIMISDASDSTERVIALEVGADDLMGRPLNGRELVARARALVRRMRALRASVPGPKGPSDQAWRLDPVKRTLSGPGGKKAMLTPQEMALMHLFLTNQGQPVTAELAAEQIGPNQFSTTSFRTSIVRLRRKLGRAGFSQFTIKTLRSGGYFVEALEVDVKATSGAAAPYLMSGGRETSYAGRPAMLA